MQSVRETMKNLQKLTESLSKLDTADMASLKSIGELPHMFNGDFWNSIFALAKGGEASPQERETRSPLEEKSFRPHIDLFQTKAKVIVCCEVPGLDLDSLETAVVNGRSLSVQGKIAEHRYINYAVKNERTYGYFHREITLPCQVHVQGMKRTYTDGLLELHFVKKQKKPAVRAPKGLRVLD